jgi:hypothetical protein
MLNQKIISVKNVLKNNRYFKTNKILIDIVSVDNCNTIYLLKIKITLIITNIFITNLYKVIMQIKMSKKIQTKVKLIIKVSRVDVKIINDQKIIYLFYKKIYI